MTAWQRARRSAVRRVRHTLVLGWAAAILACAAHEASAQHAFNLPAATDFRADAAIASAQRLPILLFFDRNDCPYCERALREFLVPMSKDSQWSGKALFRQVEIDEAAPLRDFNGATITHQAYAQRFSVRLTPTIVVVDSRGTPLGEPIVGLLTPDFYAAYLENAIDAASQKLNSGAR